MTGVVRLGVYSYTTLAGRSFFQMFEKKSDEQIVDGGNIPGHKPCTQLLTI